MCGRYQFYDRRNEKIKEIIAEVKDRYGDASYSDGEVFPGTTGVVLIAEKDRMAPKLMYWGFQNPQRKSLVINARIENIDGPFFRNDYRERRCVVPVSGFYEWDPDKKKHYISHSGSEPLYLAAIYRKQEETDSYCIITKEAAGALKSIHSRQPIIMDEDGARRYLKIEN